MPELPDVVVYVEALEARIVGHRLEHIRIVNPFVLRTALPPVAEAEGRIVEGVGRMGKRIVIALRDGYAVVLHLMIAGRLRWMERDAKPPGRITLAVLEFDNGALTFTEAGSKRRASIHIARGKDALAAFDMGGLDT